MIELLRARRKAAFAACLRTPLAGALVLLMLAFPVSVGADESASRIGRDSVGNGITLPWGLWVAGDATLHGQVPEHGPSLFEIDDMSLLARWEPTPRFALFGELRLENLLQVVEGEGASSDHWEFVFERLYAEALLTPALTLRLGTIFTPFGLWNVIQRSPFTWTVEEPAIADDVFPRHATGLSLLYQTTWQGWTFDATAYGPAQDTLRFGHPEDNDRGWVMGSRIAAGRILGPAFASLGVNAAGFRERAASTWATATGLDLEVSVGGHQVTGELTFRLPGAGLRAVHGLYLQDAIPLEPITSLARGLYGVVRFEYFQPGTGSAEIGGVLGLYWRPVPSFVLRGDYTFGSRTIDRFQPGFNCSISFLF